MKIDGIEVIANYISSTELSFDTPQNTKGFKDVIVTNSDGRSFNLVGGFEYIAPEIQNSDISSMNCVPATTPVNTSTSCTITTNVDQNVLSGSVNIRIGATGTIVNCIVGASTTSLVCNNIPVGTTPGTFPSQYNASGSGANYLDGNNITVTASSGGGSCSSGATGSGSNGTTATTDILLCLTGGSLILTSPNSTNFSSLTVGTTEQNTAANLNGVIVEDLRGSEAGWSLVCKSTNLTGVTYNDTVIPVFKDTLSKLSLTPTALEVSGGYGFLQGLTDYTSTQSTTSLTDSTSLGESNSFGLASFPQGSGVGKFDKNLTLDLTVPAYIRAQAYVGTLICSVS